MWRFARIAAICLLVGGTLGAFINKLDAQFNQQALTQGASGGGGPPTCTQLTNYLARATGMDTTHQNAFAFLICGLVSDGVITGTMGGSVVSGSTACGSLLDLLYIYATDTQAHALLNLCSTTFPSVVIASPTFTADLGFVGVGGEVDSTYSPSSAGGNFVLNGGSLGNWSFTTATNANGTMGAVDVGTAPITQIFNQFTDNNMYCDISDGGVGSENQAAVPNGAGFFACNRSGSSAVQMYRNGAALTPTAGPTPSTALNTTSLWMVGLQKGSGGNQVSNRSNSMSFVGGNLSAGNIASLQSRVCTYLTTVHGSC